MKLSKKSSISWRILTGALAFSLVTFSVHADESESDDMADQSSPWLFGYMVSQQLGLEQLGFSEEEKSQFVTGLQKGLASGNMEAIEAQMPQLQQFLQTRAMAAQANQMAEMAEQTEEFVEELESNPDIQKDDSGFYYEILEQGDENQPTMSDEVIVNYEGALIDGTVFDSSYQRGEPAVFPMGGVIKGFSGGLSKIGEGGKVRIFIPGELGYGTNPPQGSGIPPNAMLVFEAEIVDIVSADES